MNWIKIKSEIRSELLSRKLKEPNRRLNELDNLEKLFRLHFKKYIENPTQMFRAIDKNDFKEAVSKYKLNGKLNAAESSLINEIYNQINK
jgi:hypothetical protein